MVSEEVVDLWLEHAVVFVVVEVIKPTAGVIVLSIDGAALAQILDELLLAAIPEPDLPVSVHPVRALANPAAPLALQPTNSQSGSD